MLIEQLKNMFAYPYLGEDKTSILTDSEICYNSKGDIRISLTIYGTQYCRS